MGDIRGWVDAAMLKLDGEPYPELFEVDLAERPIDADSLAYDLGLLLRELPAAHSDTSLHRNDKEHLHARHASRRRAQSRSDQPQHTPLSSVREDADGRVSRWPFGSLGHPHDSELSSRSTRSVPSKGMLAALPIVRQAKEADKMRAPPCCPDGGDHQRRLDAGHGTRTGA